MKADSSQPHIQFSTLAAAIQPPVIVDLMAKALANPGLLSLAAGFTDNAVLPRDLIRETASELTETGLPNEPLQYGSNQGRIGLRVETCRFLTTYPGEKPEVFDPENVFITNGSQQALYLAMQALCDPGDIVLVQEPSYFVCLEMLKGLGLQAMGVPCDVEGAIDETALKEKLKELESSGHKDRVKAIYLVSYFSNPSSRSMPVEEKRGLAKVLQENGYRIPVIEDAAYRELYFDSPFPAPSTLSIPDFDTFPKLYLGTYTKPFATGLKIGYGICSDREWLAKMLCMKGHQDFGSSHFNQSVIESVLTRGHYAPHLHSIQKHYAEKAQRMGDALEKAGLRELGWHWKAPQGGMIFWLRGPSNLDLSLEGEFCSACIDSGILYVPGDLCFPSGAPKNYARISTGALDASRYDEAIERFRDTFKDLTLGRLG